MESAAVPEGVGQQKQILTSSVESAASSGEEPVEMEPQSQATQVLTSSAESKAASACVESTQVLTSSAESKAESTHIMTSSVESAALTEAVDCCSSLLFVMNMFVYILLVLSVTTGTS